MAGSRLLLLLLVARQQRTFCWPSERANFFSGGERTKNAERRKNTSPCAQLDQPNALVNSTARGRCTTFSGRAVASKRREQEPVSARVRLASERTVCSHGPAAAALHCWSPLMQWWWPCNTHWLVVHCNRSAFLVLAVYYSSWLRGEFGDNRSARRPTGKRKLEYPLGASGCLWSSVVIPASH